jgi:hypothetical protein
VTVLRVSAVVLSTDGEAAALRYGQVLGAPAVAEFRIPGRDLTVTAFPAVSVLSGSAEALTPVVGLRATVFVSSLAETEEQILEAGWTKEGSLGSTSSLLARDPDGNLLEFVEEVTADQISPEAS